MKKSLLIYCCSLFIVFAAKAQEPVLVKDMRPGTVSSNPHYLTALNNKVFFQNTDSGTNGNELWVTDGTDAGTFMVKDINPGSASSNPWQFTPFNNKMFFVATDVAHGIEVWVSDGTNAGTHILKDINPGTDSICSAGNNINFTKYNNRLYFLADDGTHNREIWSTDGTDTGTHMLMDLDSVGNHGAGYLAFVLGNKLYFTGSDHVNIYTGFYVTDGTDTGTHYVTRIHPQPLTKYCVYNGKAIFSAEKYNEGYELWATDGTDAGTQLLKDIWPGDFHDGNPAGFTIYNNKVYFAAEDSLHGTELWVTDGTAAGTNLANDLNTGTAPSSPGNFLEYAGKLYFSAKTPAFGTELWRVDIPAAATYMFDDIVPGTYSSTVIPRTVFSNLMYFTAVNPSYSGYRLWVTDEYLAGTHEVKPLASIEVAQVRNDIENNFVVCNGNLIFPANYFSTTGYELYKISGVVSVPSLQHSSLQAVAFPNPASDRVQLSFTLQTSSALRVSLTDITGRTVGEWNRESLDAGSHNISISLPNNISAGTYFIHIDANEERSVLKLAIE